MPYDPPLSNPEQFRSCCWLWTEKVFRIVKIRPPGPPEPHGQTRERKLEIAQSLYGAKS